MPMPEPTVRVTRYEVSCLPPDDINTPAFTITVEWRGEDRWAVMRNGAYYNLHGKKSWGVHWEDDREPVTDEEIAAYARAHEAWLAEHRFDEQTALRIAREQAPRIVVGPWTVEKVLADIAAGEADDA